MTTHVFGKDPQCASNHEWTPIWNIGTTRSGRNTPASPKISADSTYC